MQHFESFWGRPRAEFIDQLVVHIREETLDITGIQSIAAATSIIFISHKPTIEIRNWLQNCQDASEQWNAAFQRNDRICRHINSDPQEACLCLLEGLPHILKNALELKKSMPEAVNHRGFNIEAREFIAIIEEKLINTTKIILYIEHNDYAWLKEIFNKYPHRFKRPTGI